MLGLEPRRRRRTSDFFNVKASVDDRGPHACIMQYVRSDEASLSRMCRRQSPGSAGSFSSSFTSRSASAMISSRCLALRNLRKLRSSRRLATVVSSVFNAGGFDDIWMRSTADIADR